jgi:hypothetical protein
MNATTRARAAAGIIAIAALLGGTTAAVVAVPAPYVGGGAAVASAPAPEYDPGQPILAAAPGPMYNGIQLTTMFQGAAPGPDFED